MTDRQIGAAEMTHYQPVAWMVYTQDGQSCYVTDNPTDVLPDQRALPLYTEPFPTETHPAIIHCDTCGCDWLDNGLNPIGCPYCKQSAAGDEVEYEYEVWQDGDVQAGGSTTDYASAQSEANHYAMMYAQDGPVEVRIYEKRLLSADKIERDWLADAMDEMAERRMDALEAGSEDGLQAEVEALRAEVDRVTRENEAMKRCAIRYLEWLGVTHVSLDQALYEDMHNPDMCGDAVLTGHHNEVSSD